MRLIRELLAFEPQNKGTDIRMALEKVNHILKRRSIIFLVSDFIADPESYRVAMATTNRRHDLIAIDLHDPLEQEIGNVGLLAVEDPETGEIGLDRHQQQGLAAGISAADRTGPFRQGARLPAVWRRSHRRRHRSGLRRAAGGLFPGTIQADPPLMEPKDQ